MFVCTLIDIFFAIPQFIVNNLYGFFSAVPPDLGTAFDSIFGCVVS